MSTRYSKRNTLEQIWGFFWLDLVSNLEVNLKKYSDYIFTLLSAAGEKFWGSLFERILKILFENTLEVNERHVKIDGGVSSHDLQLFSHVLCSFYKLSTSRERWYYEIPSREPFSFFSSSLPPPSSSSFFIFLLLLLIQKEIIYWIACSGI